MVPAVIGGGMASARPHRRAAGAAIPASAVAHHRVVPALRARNANGPGEARAVTGDGSYQLQPLVEPQVSHFSQVPLRTIVKFEHSEHMLPV